MSKSTRLKQSLRFFNKLQVVNHFEKARSIGRVYLYRIIAGLMVMLLVVFSLLIPHDQRRLHMPEPWSYALAAQNFAQGKCHYFGLLTDSVL